MEQFSKEDLQEKTKGELVDLFLILQSKIDNHQFDGVTQMYIALNAQFLDWAEQIRKIKVRIEDDNTSDLFDKLIKLAEKSGKILENLETMHERADKQLLLTERTRKAKKGSVEDRIS